LNASTKHLKTDPGNFANLLVVRIGTILREAHQFNFLELTYDYSFQMGHDPFTVGPCVLLLISSAAIAQPGVGTVKRFSLKSTVLGEDRVILVRTPVLVQFEYAEGVG
jgi:hypothetical protein